MWGSSKEESIFHAAPHMTNFIALSYRLTCCSAKHASDFDCRVCMKLFWAIKWRIPPHPLGPKPSGKCPRFRTRFPRNGNEEEINAQRCICYGLRVCSVQQCVCMCEEATCSQCNLARSLPPSSASSSSSSLPSERARDGQHYRHLAAPFAVQPTPTERSLASAPFLLPPSIALSPACLPCVVKEREDRMERSVQNLGEG